VLDRLHALPTGSMDHSSSAVAAAL
jgi:hypothetical protein